MATTERPDFPKIIADLIGWGVSLADIAAALNVSRGAPYRWVEGSEPGFWNGTLLLSLHAKQREIHHSKSEGAQSRARIGSKTQGDDDAPDQRSDERRKRACAGG